MTAPTVLEPSLFAGLDPVRLAGSRCTACGVTVFPAGNSCPACTASAVEVVALPALGTVWSWTVQRIAPKPPYVPPASGFVPFVVGYVDLGDLLVESVLLVEPEATRIGLPVRLVLTGSGGHAFEADL